VFVRLKGIHKTTATLADGSRRTYYYLGKNGPRLEGEPGTPEFHASYNAAVEQPVAVTSDVLLSILRDFQTSSDFTGLAERTRADYAGIIGKIEKEFGDFPLAGIDKEPAKARGVFLEWRDRLAKKSLRQADYAWTVLSLILKWAAGRGKIRANPCKDFGSRLYSGSRRDKIWTDDDEAAFLEKAPAHMHLPFLLAIWTAQRQGDLLRLTWTAYDGKFIRLRQSKTGARMTIPVGAALKRALDAAKARYANSHIGSTTILCNSEGMPWTGDGFRSSWRKACAKAGVTGLTFHDLRGSTVTRLAVAGATEPEISKLTGLSIRDVRSILEKHYLGGDETLAANAVRKLETRTKLQNELQNGPDVPSSGTDKS
jgi:integrase